MERDDLKWTTLCRGKGCCPSIALEGEMLHVKDDYGQQIKITLNQLDDIVAAAGRMERVSEDPDAV